MRDVDRHALSRLLGRGEESPPAGLRLFNAVLLIRWMSLGVASIGYLWNLSAPSLDYGHFVAVGGAAVVYTLVLSLFSRPVYEFHMRSNVFLVVDYGVSFAALSLTGAVWSPLLVFAAGSVLFAGLHGTVRAGVSGGSAMAGTYLASLVAKGMSYSGLAATEGVGLALVYSLEYLLFSIIWAYSAGLLYRLDLAYREVAQGRDVLQGANDSLDARQAELMALHRIRNAILGNLDADEILAIVLDALSGMGFPRCTVWLLEGDSVRPFSPVEYLPAAPLDVEGPIGDAVRNGHVVSVSPGHGPEIRIGGGPALVVPVLSDDEAFGALVVERADDTPFSDVDVELLRLFAEQIALALRHVRLYEQAREYAVLDERNRITVQIHDTAVRNLQEASAAAESLRSTGAREADAGRLALLADTVTASLKDLRFAVLNWASLDWETAVSDIVRRYVREFTELSGIPVDIAANGQECPLASPVLKDLVRILQESLSNVWRHAEASSVRITLDFVDSGVAMIVRDDGRGYDPAAAEKGAGIGLRSIRTRSERGGGSAVLTSAPGDGAEVRVWFPC
ncbi:MAG TPA: GAF domain-containing protein [Coriobacteriia bacterium]